MTAGQFQSYCFFESDSALKASEFLLRGSAYRDCDSTPTGHARVLTRWPHAASINVLSFHQAFYDVPCLSS